ncbi:mitoferrin-1-like [Acanthaster planci]|uniref:Mitoferrin-1-like n=1 Tax=Acanthaster planci TaxID=133434 RepID=A0A8B7XL41_ACAPL|nr:mitoferrin-1-like [Acanthaster planci]
MLTPRNIYTPRISDSLPKIQDYDFGAGHRRVMDKDSEEHNAINPQNGIASNLLELAVAASEEYEYESLPETTTLTTHLMAGAIAGIMEHCVMYPVDSVKTRMQTIRPSPSSSYRNVFNGMATIIRNEGPFGMVRGLHAVACGAGPAHALYFACYEKMKHVLSSQPGQNPLANACAGSLATLLHDAAMNPVEVVKQRMQMFQSPYKSVTECIRTIVRAEGMHAFYRSYTTQLTMNIPFQSIHFVTYELGQETLNPKREYNPTSHMVSGGLAGATAAAITTPLDVCKTLLNTQEKGVLRACGQRRTEIKGMVNAFRTVYRMSGVRGYFKGLHARVIFQMPATALSWSVYEFFKYFITMNRA